VIDVVVRAAVRDVVAVATFVTLVVLHTVNGELARRAWCGGPRVPATTRRGRRA